MNVHERAIELYESKDTKMKNIIKAQEIAKRASKALAEHVRPGMTQAELYQFCREKMLEYGATGWWHGGAGLVLFGDMSTYSGKYNPDPIFVAQDLKVGENDIVTADLVPDFEGGWGDFTRSIFLEDGVVKPIEEVKNPDYIEGMELEYRLHEAMSDFVDETKTFEDLYYHLTGILNEVGYQNLDYHDNFGHSIENHKDERVTIAIGEKTLIVAHGKPLSFEPHISKRGGTVGVKHEDTYVYIDGKMRAI